MKRVNESDMLERIDTISFAAEISLNSYIYVAGFTDALNILKQFIEGVDEHETDEYSKDEWISVQDRLPKDGYIVLVKAKFFEHTYTQIAHFDYTRNVWTDGVQQIENVIEWKSII